MTVSESSATLWLQCVGDTWKRKKCATETFQGLDSKDRILGKQARLSYLSVHRGNRARQAVVWMHPQNSRTGNLPRQIVY